MKNYQEKSRFCTSSKLSNLKKKSNQRVPMAKSWMQYFKNKELIVNLQSVYYEACQNVAGTTEDSSHKTKALFTGF